MDTKWKILIILIILGIVIRAKNLDKPFSCDTDQMALASTTYIKTGKPYCLNWRNPDFDVESHNYELIEGKKGLELFYYHPPMELWIYGSFVLLPLKWNVSLRIISLVLGIISIGLIFMLTKKIYGEKPAIITTGIVSIAVHAVYHQSFRLTKEAILIPLVVLVYYNYFIWKETQKYQNILIIGLLGGLMILTRTVSIILMFILSAYEIMEKRWKSVIVLIILPLLIFGTWVVYDKNTNNGQWYNSLGIQSKPPEIGWKIINEGYSAKRSLINDLVQTGVIAIQLGPALIVMFFLSSFEILKKIKKEFKFKELIKYITNKEIILLSWIALWFFGFFFTSGGGGSSTEKYFYVAVPFVYIISSKIFIGKNLNYKEILISSVIYLGLLVTVKFSDVFYYNYLLYGNLGGIVVWFLPIIVLPIVYIWKKQLTKNILLGVFIAFSAYAIIVPSSVWIYADASAVQEINKLPDDIEIFSRNGHIIQGAIFYDWLDNYKIDRLYTIIQLKNYSEVEKKLNCQTGYRMAGGYPLYYYCPRSAESN